jgi:type III restriction enzyme
MRIELKEFQNIAVQDLLGKIKRARREAAEDGSLQAIILSSPTGSGKTITLTALIERILRGDETEKGDSNAAFLWLSDSPELNEQSRDKLLKTSSIFRPHDLPVIDATFDQERFTPGKVYFLNTQKIGKDKLLVTKGDRRTFTLWETIRNSEADTNLRFYVVIDEAHRGTAQDPRDYNAANSIIQKFVKGSDEIPPIRLIIGMSATPQKFIDILDINRRTPRPVTINPADVRASGLLKDSIVIRHPTESQPSDTTLLRAATKRWRKLAEEWRDYAASQKMDAPVKPVLVVQVENGTQNRLTNTDLPEALGVIEGVIGRLEEDEIVHCFQEDTAIEANGYKIRKAEASKIQDDDRIKIVLFKTSLTTGWDCPRAEVMMSYRGASDPTNIAQLVGRMVRTPLARRVESSEVLNSVSLYLPHYNEKALREIVEKLSNPSAEDGLGVADVRLGSEVVELSKDPKKADLFDVLAELPSYSIERIPKASKVARLIKLARQLNLDGIDEDAWDEAKALVVRTLVSEAKRLQKVKAFADAINEKKEISIRAVTFDYNKLAANEGEEETIPATPENIESLFDLCGKMLGEGLHMEFWRKTVDMDDPLRAKLVLYLVLQDDAAGKRLEELCGGRLEELFEKYSRDIRGLTTSAREKYRKIRQQAKDPEPVDLIYPQTIQLTKGETRWRDHLYVDSNGDFHTDLNSWEEAVLKEEMGKPGFAGWLRNVDRKQWALTIPYEMSGEVKPTYPDFIILRRKGKQITVDVLEPHTRSFADAVYKAKGFANYAERHREFFRRIELIEVIKDKGTDRIKRLNVAEEKWRDRVKRISTADELNSVFENL